MSKKLTDAKRAAIKRYDEASTTQIHLKLNLKTDADILEYLSKQESKQGCIKACLRAAMKTEEESRRRLENHIESCRLAKIKLGEMEIPLRDGYRDEEACKIATQEQHDIFVTDVFGYEVRIDVDAKKVLIICARRPEVKEGTIAVLTPV